MPLEQRQPRIIDEAWLALVRKMPCTICRRPGPNDPAHLRSIAPQYGKSITGRRKPDDCWVLPLCRAHHDDQHRGNELRWWLRHGVPDPFALAVALYATRPAELRPLPAPARPKKVRARKPPSERRKVGPSRPIPQRKADWPKRPMQSRNNLRKAKV